MSSLTTLFTNIANAIRTKKGTSASITASDFPNEIASIQTGITPTGTIPITTNGTVDVTNYANADVSVQPNLQSISQTITTNNTTTTFTPDTGYDGLSSVAITTNVSGGDNLKITNASYLFYYGVRTDYCNELMSKIENCSDYTYMFNHASDITSVDVSDIKFHESQNLLQLMFQGCSKITTITLPSTPIKAYGSMDAMFSGCARLQTIDFSKIDTSQVTSLHSVLAGDAQLASIDLSSWDTSNVENMTKMLALSGARTSSWVSINLGNLNCEKVNTINSVLQGSYNTTYANLTTIQGSFYNLGKGYVVQLANFSSYQLDMTALRQLTETSLMNIINGLYDLNLTYDVAGGGTLYTQSLALGATNRAKLTAEQIAIATNKGWTVS